MELVALLLGHPPSVNGDAAQPCSRQLPASMERQAATREVKDHRVVARRASVSLVERSGRLIRSARGALPTSFQSAGLAYGAALPWDNYVAADVGTSRSSNRA